MSRLLNPCCVLCCMLSACAAVCPRAAWSQTPDASHLPQTAPQDPSKLAALVVQHFQAAQAERVHYIYSSHAVSIWTDARGKVTRHEDWMSESLLSDGYPYQHVIARNGHKLKGKELKAWNATSLTLRHEVIPDEQKATVARPEQLPNLLAVRWQNSVAGHETIDGRDCIILDAAPGPDLKMPIERKHIRLWADVATLAILRYVIEFPEDDGAILAGSHEDIHFAYVGTEALPASSDIEFRHNDPGEPGYNTHVTHTVYSNYQRYNVKVTISSTPPSPSPPSKDPQ